MYYKKNKFPKKNSYRSLPFILSRFASILTISLLIWIENIFSHEVKEAMSHRVAFQSVLNSSLIMILKVGFQL